MKIRILKQNKVIPCLFLCISGIVLVKLIFISGNRFEQGEEIIKYRNLLEQNGEHQPYLLKDALYRQFKHRDPLVRKNVAEVIGELNEPDTADTLWDILTNEKNRSVRHAAATAMHRLGDKSAVRYLVRLLDDDDVLVRREAAIGLCDFDDVSILEELEEAYRRESDKLNKLTIASSMAQLGDEKKARFIEKSILNSPEPEVRKYAAYMLCMLEINSNITVLKSAMNQEEEDLYVKVCVAGALAKRGDSPGLDYLRDIVSKSKIAALKSYAAHALSEIEDFEYVYPFLVELLKEREPRIRERAVEDLVGSKNPQLVHILGDILLNDENIIVREIAAWALGESKDEIALPYLEKGLYDDSAFVRTGVAAAIYKIIKR